jgi:hypothetical protein
LIFSINLETKRRKKMRSKVINKPSWKDAPKWANYLCQDSDGTWSWFEDEPRPQKSSGYFAVSRGRVKVVDTNTENWHKTLEKRKTNKKR